ncbi:MAG: HDIG domain-containing protein [Eubacteriales bacterium]|nr:HDIG domain-containing protein [Eubacteriales bacterium]
MNKADIANINKKITTVKNAIQSDSFKRLAISTFGSIVILFIVLAAITPIRYDLRLGMVPNVTISASKDVVDEITTEKNKFIAAQNVTPTYKYQDGVTEQVLLKLNDIKSELNAVMQYAATLDDYSLERKFTPEELEYASNMLKSISLRNFQLQSLMTTSQEDFEVLFDALKDTIVNTMQTNITQGQENTAINSIISIIGYKTEINVLQNIASPVLKSVILPNMVIDQEATDLAKQTAMESVDPVVYKQGQNIVVKGEGRIRENQLKMLDSLGLLNTNKTDYSSYIGAVILVLLSLVSLNLCLAYACPELYQDNKRLLVLYIIFILTLLLCVVTRLIDFIYLSPMLLVPMLLTVLLGYMPALITNIVFGVIASYTLSIGGHNTSLDVTFLLSSSIVAGAISALLLKENSRRTNVLLTGFISSIISAATIIASGIMLSNDISLILLNAALASGGAVLATFLCIGLQPPLEYMFNLPTQSRLIELSNPTQPLLHRLLTEAPGTYHHSIIVANLAEAAAEAIGISPYLPRVGGYYHDIGKLKRPLYFKENQINQDNILDENEPQVSATIITAHIRDGVALAKQYRLPPEVQAIIAGHHGNSLVRYFYSKAVEQHGEENINDADFRYDGYPPKSVEAALIMLCDTIEAAVRTLKHPTKEEINDFILKLIQQIIDSGQLRNAPLTMADLYKIAQSCSTVLYGVFHERIEYPSPQKKKRLSELLSNKNPVKKPPENETLSPNPVKNIDIEAKENSDNAEA